MEIKHFDDLLTHLGTGKWNALYFFTYSYWWILYPSQYFSGIYLAPSLNYTCVPPSDENVTGISSDSCTYTVNRTSSDFLEETLPCTDWDFDTSVFSNTLTSEFYLVCDREPFRATYQSVFMLGSFASPLVGGYLADRIGRMPIIITAQIVTIVGGISTSFLFSLTALIVVRFMMGLASIITLFYLTMEVCEPKHRTIVGIVTGLPWALGTMLLALLAFLIRDWRWLQFAFSTPNITMLLLVYLIDESPRWLIVRGHHERALKALQRAARWNKVTLPPKEELLQIMKNIQEAEGSPLKSTVGKESRSDDKKKRFSLTAPKLCSTHRITLIACVISFNFFVMMMVFDGLTMGGDIFGDDIFLYLVLSALMEVPGYVLPVPIVNRLGRKGPTSFSFLICGVFIFALAFIPSEISWLVKTLSLLGKVFISAALQIMYLYAAELYPTEVRLQGSGMANAMAQFGATLSPFIVMWLGPVVPWAPSVVYGVAAFITGLTTLALPETRNCPLPDFISDLDYIWKKKKTRSNTIGNISNCSSTVSCISTVSSISKNTHSGTNDWNNTSTSISTGTHQRDPGI